MIVWQKWLSQSQDTQTKKQCREQIILFYETRLAEIGKKQSEYLKKNSGDRDRNLSK